MKTNLFVFSISLILLGACDSNSEPDPVMKQAFSVHNQALAAFDSLHTILKTESEGASEAYKAKLDSIDTEMHEWEETLVEVPGFEHDHDHGEHEGHDHDHDHDASAEQYKDLPPAEMLAAQQAFLAEILRIGSQIDVAKAASMVPMDSTATEE